MLTSIVLVDPNHERRLRLEKELLESNQFGRVNSCADLGCVQELVHRQEAQVLLLDRSIADDVAGLDRLRSLNPQLGLVLLTESTQPLGGSFLAQLGLHAEIQRSASPMEWVGGIAKALVNRFKPTKLMRLLKS